MGKDWSAEKVEGIAPLIAAKAQEIYNEWEQDDSGYDEEFGTGGICDAIADAIMSVLAENFPTAYVDIGGQEGDDHAWIVITWRNGWQTGVDISPNVYEHGSGYVWTKREGVEILPSDVNVFTLGYAEPELVLN